MVSLIATTLKTINNFPSTTPVFESANFYLTPYYLLITYYLLPIYEHKEDKENAA